MAATIFCQIFHLGEVLPLRGKLANGFLALCIVVSVKLFGN